MKKVSLVITGFIFLFVVSGCQSNKTRVAEGAVIGTVLGAAAGGIIGHQGHHGGEGAAIGAAAGALTGALIGAQVNKPGQTNVSAAQQTASASNPNQMSMQQIIDLSRQGINENVIIDKIRLTNSKFTLTADDLANLKNQGVSQNVIAVMQGAA